MRRIIFLFFAVLCVPAEARTWQLDLPRFPVENLATLSRKYPEIQDATQLAQIMSEITALQPLLRLEAYLKDDVIIIRGVPAASIGEINVTLTTRMFRADLETLVHKYLGEVDSEEIRGKIREQVARYLAVRGFYQASIHLSAETIGDTSYYQFNIEEGFPCLFREVMTGFTLPGDLIFEVKAGDICDRHVAEAAVRKLEDRLKNAGYNQQRILNPEIRYDALSNSAVLFVPGTVGKKIRYSINSPVATFFDSDLREIDPSIVDPDLMASEIERKYRAAGYDDVVVSQARKNASGAEGLVYSFDVEPGVRYSINEIQFEGLALFSREEALKIMDFESFIRFGAPPLNQEIVRLGIDSLKNRYAAEGYWDTKISQPRVTKERATGQAKLAFVIREGKQRIFSSFSASGNHALSTKDIKSALPGAIGKPLIFSNLAQLDKALKAKLRRLGYIYGDARINLKEDSSEAQILAGVDVVIEEGPRVKFGEVSISGLIRTHQKVVRRELRFKPGDWYDPEKIDETREALLNLGLFHSVTIVAAHSNTVEGGDQESLPYMINLRESKPGVISFGPGWSLVDGARYTLETSYNNIYGLNRQVFMRGDISEEANQDAIGNKTLLGHSTTVGYVEPYLAELPVNGSISLSNRAKPGPKRWDLSKTAELALSHKLRILAPGAKVESFYGQKINREEAGSPQRDNLVATGNVRIGRVGGRVTYDKRNDLSWPTKGYTVDAETSWASFGLGGNLRYFYWDLANNYYVQVRPRWVVALGYSFSAYEGIDRRGDAPNVLPASERLIAGGPDTNRGFQTGSLGPHIDYFDAERKDRFHPSTGGSHRSIFKLELRYQILKDTLAITGFTDSSAVFFSRSEINAFEKNFAENAPEGGEAPSRIYDNQPYDFEDVLKTPQAIRDYSYISYGLALNLLTPLGSVNLSYGLPIKRCPTKNSQCIAPQPEGGDGVVHFNVGANF